VSVTLKAVPAVCELGVGTVKELAEFAATVKLGEIPLSALCVAVRVVVCASYNVIGDAVPTPAVNVTEDG
jgi:hypothetical protein